MRTESAHNAALLSWMNTLIGYVQSARPDLTNRQMALLMVVYLTPGPHTVRGLAERLRVSKPVVTRALNTLGAFGYLRRQKDEADLRNIFVQHTEDGEAFLSEFMQLIRHGADNDDGGAQNGSLRVVSGRERNASGPRAAA